MKISTKLSLAILISGITVLCLFALVVFKFSSNSDQENQFKYTKSITTKMSDDIDMLFLEKVKTARTLASTPMIKTALASSNSSYTALPDEKRNESINRLNRKWKSITDPEDTFILKFTDNKVSHFLKNQQDLLPGEYGEIFLTNQFGALVASTSKLSTFAHGHKYWWTGAYKQGEGAVFFDDRGYDDSVGGYVLGLVVPVKNEERVIGILKLNLNILGSVSKMLSVSRDEFAGRFKLGRSCGMIVFEEGIEPLSTQLPGPAIVNIQEKKNNPFFLDDSTGKYLVGFSEIKMTTGKNGYGFGGTFGSIDHQKGNTGESWYVLNYRLASEVRTTAVTLIKWIVVVGSVIIFFLAVVSFVFGQTLAKPFEKLKTATEKIGTGNFEYQINAEQFNNEFKNLASSFNQMITRLKQTTTSIRRLEDEIDDHRKSKAQAVQNRLFLESSLESSRDMIILSLDHNYRYYFFNKTHAESMKRVFGTQPEIGDCIFDFMKGQDDIKKVKDHYDRALAGESHIDIEAYGQDPKRYYYEIQYNPMYDSENRIIGITSFAQDITERKKRQKQIQASLNEKEVLLSEIHHRVKNNMQVIISLLRLQSGKTDDKRYAELLMDSERRVLSMALVHEQLYQSSTFSNINLKEYFDKLLKDLFISCGGYSNSVEYAIHCVDIFFDLDNAVPLGLIVNELVSNSLKYAFPDNRKGRIDVSVSFLNENEFELSVSDDGVGIPEEMDINNLESMGMHLVRVLVKDTFEGKMVLDRTEGTRLILKLKKLKYRQRI